MKKSVVVFSIVVIAIISLFLLFCILGIILYYWGESSAAKDALSIVSGLFGGITTLGAAIIAAYLFNDWKEQQRHQNSLDFAKVALDSYKAFDRSFDALVDSLATLLACLENDSSYTIDEDWHNEIIEDCGKTVDLFYYFHNDFVNYLYVKYPLDLDNDLVIDTEMNINIEKWESDLHSFHEKIYELSLERRKRAQNLTILRKLTSPPMEDLSGDCVAVIRETILKPLKLEDS
ncbi:hypothetical protein ACPER7_06115 [Acinetobacter dispersus]|uniref:hypothetical protein n=1 Tax=Acinetobacter dispersus TaxID=70348 RepID=UPI003C30C8A6